MHELELKLITHFNSGSLPKLITWGNNKNNNRTHWIILMGKLEFFFLLKCIFHKFYKVLWSSCHLNCFFILWYWCLEKELLKKMIKRFFQRFGIFKYSQFSQGYKLQFQYSVPGSTVKNILSIERQNTKAEFLVVSFKFFSIISFYGPCHPSALFCGS